MEESGASSSGRTTRQRHHQLSRRCGIIRFRPLDPSTDRKQIQKLHEEWFPVDYTEEFFDFLCLGGRSTSPPLPDIPASTNGDSSSSSNNLAQTNIKSPLYCQVATFTALSVEEYTKRKRRKEMRKANNNVQSKKMTTNTTTTTTTTMTKKLRLSALLWSYFWPFNSTHDAADVEDENDEIIDEHYDDDDDDDDDCILWEEESNYDENKINEQVVQQVVVGQTIKIDTDGNSDIIIKQGNDCTVMQRQIVDVNDDDDIEEGVGVGFNERREKERMIQFYANGCKKSNDDGDESDQDIMYNTRVNGVDGATSLYSDNDGRLQKECIIGCIIGTYLRSDMPALNSNINSNNTNNNKHCNSTPTSNIDGGVLDTNNDNRSAFKIIPCRNGNRKNNITLPPPPPPASRDETASLLISDPSAYPRMFYIMTLGTARTFRRYGLGSMLIESIITMIENEGTTSTSSSTTSSSSMGLEENDTYETAMQKGRALARCGRPTQLTGVLYLHVIIYNTGAIRMYERLGFIRVKEIQGKNVHLIVTTYIYLYLYPNIMSTHLIYSHTTYESFFLLTSLSLFSTLNHLFYTSDYYTINSVNYNCYLYARYFHGNIGHYRTRSKLDGIYCYAKSFVRSFLGYSSSNNHILI